MLSKLLNILKSLALVIRYSDFTNLISLIYNLLVQFIDTVSINVCQMWNAVFQTHTVKIYFFTFHSKLLL